MNKTYDFGCLERAVVYAQHDVDCALLRVASLAEVLLKDFHGDDFTMSMLRDAVAEWRTAVKRRDDVVAELKAFKFNYWDSKR